MHWENSLPRGSEKTVVSDRGGEKKGEGFRSRDSGIGKKSRQPAADSRLREKSRTGKAEGNIPPHPCPLPRRGEGVSSIDNPGRSRALLLAMTESRAATRQGTKDSGQWFVASD